MHTTWAQKGAGERLRWNSNRTCLTWMSCWSLLAQPLAFLFDGIRGITHVATARCCTSQIESALLRLLQSSSSPTSSGSPFTDTCLQISSQVQAIHLGDRERSRPQLKMDPIPFRGHRLDSVIGETDYVNSLRSSSHPRHQSSTWPHQPVVESC